MLPIQSNPSKAQLFQQSLKQQRKVNKAGFAERQQIPASGHGGSMFNVPANCQMEPGEHGNGHHQQIVNDVQHCSEATIAGSNQCNQMEFNQSSTKFDAAQRKIGYAEMSKERGNSEKFFVSKEQMKQDNLSFFPNRGQQSQSQISQNQKQNQNPLIVQTLRKETETDKNQLTTQSKEYDQETEYVNFRSRRNPHDIIRERQKKEKLYLFAAYDQLADPDIFKQILLNLPTQRQFPQEMCQLIVKDFELCFGHADSSSHQSQTAYQPMESSQQVLKNPQNTLASSLADDSPMKQEYYPSRKAQLFGKQKQQNGNPIMRINQDESVLPYIRKAQDRVLFVNAYLIPIDQLIELICYLTGCNKIETKIPSKFSFRYPLKLMTPRGSFYNILCKVSPFEQLDVLCLSRDENKELQFLQSAEISQTRYLSQKSAIPSRDLVHGLFRTYTKVFRKDETEHTLLYYLYKLDQIRNNYKLTDLVQVVAMELIKTYDKVQQEEPTIMDEQNMSIGCIQTSNQFPSDQKKKNATGKYQTNQKLQNGGTQYVTTKIADFDFLSSCKLSDIGEGNKDFVNGPKNYLTPTLNKEGQQGGFKISLLEMPLDLESPISGKKVQQSLLNDGNNIMIAGNIQTSGGHENRSKNHLRNRPQDSSQGLSQQNSQLSLNFNGHQRDNIQEILSMASEKRFGLGGRIISKLKNQRYRAGPDTISRNSASCQSGMNTINSDLTAFGICPFDRSNLSLSVYGGMPGGPLSSNVSPEIMANKNFGKFNFGTGAADRRLTFQNSNNQFDHLLSTSSQNQ